MSRIPDRRRRTVLVIFGKPLLEVGAGGMISAMYDVIKVTLVLGRGDELEESE